MAILAAPALLAVGLVLFYRNRKSLGSRVNTQPILPRPSPQVTVPKITNPKEAFDYFSLICQKKGIDFSQLKDLKKVVEELCQLELEVLDHLDDFDNLKTFHPELKMALWLIIRIKKVVNNPLVNDDRQSYSLSLIHRYKPLVQKYIQEQLDFELLKCCFKKAIPSREFMPNLFFECLPDEKISALIVNFSDDEINQIISHFTIANFVRFDLEKVILLPEHLKSPQDQQKAWQKILLRYLELGEPFIVIENYVCFQSTVKSIRKRLNLYPNDTRLSFLMEKIPNDPLVQKIQQIMGEGKVIKTKCEEEQLR